MSLKAKVAVVTGAGSTVGRAICLEFVREGLRVVASDREAEAGTSAAGTLRQAGGEVHFTPCDLMEEGQLQELIGDASMAFGSSDVLVNGATVRVEGDALSNTPQE